MASVGEPLYTSRMKSLRFLLPVLVACGGTQDGSTATGGGGGGGGGAGKPAQAGDVALEVPTIAIAGVVFEPLALGRPGIPTSAPKKKTTIEKQRALVTSAKDPVQKQAHAVGLATLLYVKSKEVQGDEQKTLMTEARQVLRDVSQTLGDKTDEVTMLFLASYEMYFEDYPAADKAWDALIKKTAASKDKDKDKDLPYFKTWWGFALLKQFKNAEALALVKDEPVSEKHPELAYVIAWSKWRANDDAGAWQAISTAAKAWPSKSDVLNDELYLFAARSNVSFSEVTPQLFGVFNAKQKAQQYEVLVKLGLKAYAYAGRWADGVAALDKALETMGKDVPAHELPVIRYSQADFTVRLDDPERAAKYAKQAVEALPGCGQKCTDKDKQDVVSAVSGIARVFHFVYATANDVRYYQPANDLYLLTIPLIMDTTARNERNKDADTLQRTLKNTKAGTGTHDKDAVRVLTERHNQEIQACYEATLTTSPKLGGSITVQLESDATGAIKGVTTEPKAGLAELSAVAGCVADQVKTWKLPKRGMPGSTRIKLSYTLATKKLT